MSSFFWVHVQKLVTKLVQSYGRIGITALAFAGLAFTGCGKPSPTTSADVYAFETPKELAAAVQNYSVTCTGTCPENVGVLLAIDTDTLELRSCTLSLVAPNIVLTNRHCLPDALAKPGVRCDGKIQALFAKNGDKEVHACARVLSIPDDYKDDGDYHRDFAFIQLATSSARSPLAIQTTGLIDNEGLRVVAATPFRTKTTLGSDLAASDCITHMNSNVVPSFTSPQSPIASFRGCKVVPGNSGAPLISSQGSIKAISQAGPDYTAKIEKKTLRGRFFAIQQEGKFSLGTNAACFDNEALGLSSARSGCNTHSDPYKFSFENAGLDDAKEIAKREQLIARLESEVPSLRFQQVEEKLSREDISEGVLTRITIAPFCVRSTDASFAKSVKYAAQAFTYYRDFDENARYLVRASLEERRVSLTLQRLSDGTTVQEITRSSKASASKKSYRLESCAQ